MSNVAGVVATTQVIRPSSRKLTNTCVLALCLHRNCFGRSETNDGVTNVIDIIEVYKTEPDESYEQEISFNTDDTGVLCVLDFQIGEEYTLGLYRSTTNDPFSLHYCDYEGTWGSLTKTDIYSLEYRCVDYCDGECNDSQV